MNARIRIEAAVDGRHLATILIGDGQVRSYGEPLSDPELRKYVGFRTPALEAALVAGMSKGPHRFLLEKATFRGPKEVGSVLNAEETLDLLGWQYGGMPQERCGEGSIGEVFLDTLFAFSLPEGRVIRVTGLSVLPHYDTILEGSPTAKVNAITRERHDARAREHGEPVVTVEPKMIPLIDDSRGLARYPRCACVATLKSAPLEPDQTWSELTLLWWEERMDLPWREVVPRALLGIDWGASARDFDFW